MLADVRLRLPPQLLLQYLKKMLMNPYFLRGPGSYTRLKTDFKSGSKWKEPTLTLDGCSFVDNHVIQLPSSSTKKASC